MAIIKALIIGHYHLWFVYLIIGLYILVPLLRLWVKPENKKQIEYFLILALIFAFLIPQIVSIGSIYNKEIFGLLNEVNNSLHLNYVGEYASYFVLGWYPHWYGFSNKIAVYILGVVGLLITIFGTYFLAVSSDNGTRLYDILGVNILFQAVALFTLVKEKVFLQDAL